MVCNIAPGHGDPTMRVGLFRALLILVKALTRLCSELDMGPSMSKSAFMKKKNPDVHGKSESMHRLFLLSIRIICQVGNGNAFE